MFCKSLYKYLYDRIALLLVHFCRPVKRTERQTQIDDIYFFIYYIVTRTAQIH